MLLRARLFPQNAKKAAGNAHTVPGAVPLYTRKLPVSLLLAVCTAACDSTPGAASPENSAGGAGGAGGGSSGAPAGAAGETSSATGGTAGASPATFTLAWQDEFDTLDSSLWQLMTHSWDGNLAQFSSSNTSIADGILSIHLTPEPTDTIKPYRGVELRSVRTLSYGKVEASIRFARGSGVVSGLVLIYTPWPADDWNEIDIEHLGRNAEAVQLNCQVYEGPPTTPPVTQSVVPTRYEQITPLPFDAQDGFHTYTIEWTPAEVRFEADGVLLRTWDSQIARMKLPQNVLFTIWASNAASWAGAIQPDSAPTSAQIDWIRVYEWQG